MVKDTNVEKLIKDIVVMIVSLVFNLKLNLAQIKSDELTGTYLLLHTPTYSSDTYKGKQ